MMTCTCTNEKKDPFSNLLYDRQLRTEKEACSKLKAYLFYLWTFVAEQGLWEDALDFLDEHYDLPVPFDVFLYDEPLLASEKY